MKKKIELTGNGKIPRMRKLFRIMKLTSLFLLISVTWVFANETYSQTKTLNLNMEKATVKEVLSQIEDQSEFYFMYSGKFIDVDREVTVNVENKKIETILNLLFGGTDVNYVIKDKFIVLTTPDFTKNGLMPTLQQKEIFGTVTDSKGQPLPGVTIIIVGTTTGTVTDARGQYSLPNVSRDATLQFSFIGMETQEVPVQGKESINVIMKEESIGIEEVVAIGYGTVKKSDLTGSLASVKASDFKMQPLVQVSDILQGRSAGVVATSTSGRVGSTPQIRVRGTTSINKGNDPLWVVDGVIDGKVVNPDDIASIEILKDASSTAIYGSRGANGVILVTTKHGKEGKTQVSVSSNTSISNIINNWDLMNTHEFATAYNSVMGSTFSDTQLSAFKNGTAGTDWVDLLTRTGITQDYRLGVSGGNQKTRYNISGNYVNQKGTLEKSKYERFNFKTNIDTELTPWLNVFSSVNLTKSAYHNQGDMSEFRTILEYSPVVELLDEDGYCIDDSYNTIHDSPYKRMINLDDSKYHNANALLNFTFDIMDGLTFSALGSANYEQAEDYEFESSKQSKGSNSYVANSSTRSFGWQTTENLTYQKDFGEHHLTATAVFEASKSEITTIGVTGNKLISEKVLYWNVANANTRNASNGYTDASMTSFFGRALYNYKDRYFVTGTIRADGSSKFQGDNKWGYFPSGALAWNITNEDFMQDQDIFQQLKLRTSYGVTGNQGIDSYATLGSLSQENYPYGTSTLYTGYWQETIATPGLTWEKTYQYDIGIDMMFFNQRLGVSLDWYQKDTKDMLFQKSIPYYDGGGTYWTNQGEMKNTGLDFSINADILRKSELKWQSTLNGSYNKNEIVDLAGEEYIIPDASRGSLMSPSYIMKPGHSIGTFYLYQFEGFDDNGCSLYRTSDGGTTTSPNASDKQLTGNSIPKFTLGWNNSFRWRNWEANILLRANFGVDKLDVMKFALVSQVGASRFIRLNEAYSKSWDNVSNKEDAVYASLANGNNNYEGASTQWLEKANFLRCQNIVIAYHLRGIIAKGSDLVLSVGAQNLFTITKYDGMDPETVSEHDNDQQSGYDLGAVPLSRTFNFGVKFNF